LAPTSLGLSPGTNELGYAIDEPFGGLDRCCGFFQRYGCIRTDLIIRDAFQIIRLRQEFPQLGG